MVMDNKYIKLFKEACEKIEETDYSNKSWDEIPPSRFTDDQLAAKDTLNKLIKEYQEGLITGKELVNKCILEDL